MLLKIIGVIFVIGGCGGVGFRIAAIHRQEEWSLRQLIGILDYMACELQYRKTPLPQLCRLVAREFPKLPGAVFFALATKLEKQTSPSLADCLETVLENFKAIPPITRQCLQFLGHNIGAFDLEGQLKGLEAVRQDCRRRLSSLEENRDVRIRSYQTLGICAGAALAILFI